MKTIIKKIFGVVARIYHRIRNTNFVYWGIINKEGSDLLKKEKIVLNDKEKEILQTLQRDGIAIVHFSDLLPQNKFDALKSYADTRWKHPDVVKRFNERHSSVKNGKLLSKDYFLINLWEGEKILDLSNPFIKFSLEESVLRIINTYLKTFSKFRGWHLQVTTPMPEGDRRYGSQEWHRDPEDNPLIKTFLYMNDVTEGAGPFMYLRYSHDQGKWNHLFPQQPPRGSVGKEEDLPKEDVVVATGKAGTFVLCDTSGLHRGGYATTANRFMYTSVYTTPGSLWPIIFKYGPKIDNQNLSKQAQFAIDNDPNQKDPRYFAF